MKNIGILFIMIFASAACFAQDAESVKRLEASIDEYQTYNWISDIDKIPSDKMFIGPNGVLIFNNETARKNIKEAIKTQLKSKGYTMDENNPDMLVSFQVLEQEAGFRTYTGYETTYLGMDTVREEEDVEMVNVNPGTLFINFIDAESGIVVWQGYHSGALNEQSVKSKNDVKAAVASIVNEFEFSAFNEN